MWCCIGDGAGKGEPPRAQTCTDKKVFGDIGHAQERISARVGMGYWER